VPLAPEFPAALAAASRRHRCTTFVLVYAAVAVVLANHTSQSTVVIGTPVDTREPEHEQTVGMFTNLLALRVGVAAGTTARQLLADARKAVFGGLSHRHLPVGEISPQPPFRVLLITDPAYPDRNPPEGLRIDPAYKPSPAAHFDLTVLYASQPPKLYADYPAGRYEPYTVESFLGEVARELQGLAADC
jgi:non-ribosomal peptide synthetase component F